MNFKNVLNPDDDLQSSTMISSSIRSTFKYLHYSTTENDKKTTNNAKSTSIQSTISVISTSNTVNQNTISSTITAAGGLIDNDNSLFNYNKTREKPPDSKNDTTNLGNPSQDTQDNQDTDKKKVTTKNPILKGRKFRCKNKNL